MNQRNDGSTTVGGNVTGTGIAVGAGAQAHVATGTGSPVDAVLSAISVLRDELARLDTHDDEIADRVALAEARLKRLEEAAAARGQDRDSGRVRKLLASVVEALGGLTTLAGGLTALKAAVTALLA